jgi:hypothetical protein
MVPRTALTATMVFCGYDLQGIIFCGLEVLRLECGIKKPTKERVQLMNRRDKCSHGYPLDEDCPDCEEQEEQPRPGGK